MSSFVNRIWSGNRSGHQRVPTQSSSSMRAPDFDSFDDESSPSLNTATSQPASHAAPGRQQARRVPGGYDFEPQGTEGSPDVSIERGHLANDGDDDEDGDGDRPRTAQRLLPAALYSRWSRATPATRSSENEQASLLFNADDESTDTEARPRAATATTTTAYPPSSQSQQSRNSLLPLPARPPPQHQQRTVGGGQSNDGVFANLSAKPEGFRRPDGTVEYVGGDDAYGDKDEVPPSYEVAALDATPAYWETTVITPSGFLGPDDICVDGMPVGNFFSFAWNMLVSMSFQFVGFLLTYLLHTTHAAKNGSRAGLGITMIQLGFYLKQRADHPELIELMPNEIGPDGGSMMGNNNPAGDPLDTSWTWWGGVAPPLESPTPTSVSGSLPTQIATSLSGVLDVSDPEATGRLVSNTTMPTLGQLETEELIRMSANASEWMAFLFVTVGSFLLIGAVLSYWRAVRWARAVRSGMAGPENDSEARLGVL